MQAAVKPLAHVQKIFVYKTKTTNVTLKLFADVCKFIKYFNSARLMKCKIYLAVSVAKNWIFHYQVPIKDCPIKTELKNLNWKNLLLIFVRKFICTLHLDKICVAFNNLCKFVTKYQTVLLIISPWNVSEKLPYLFAFCRIADV